jgi:small-conductance mechanosensitive channel
MQAAIKDNKRILALPAADVTVKGFSEYGIDLTMSVWILNPEIGKSAFQSALNLAIWHSFKANDIAFGKYQLNREYVG